MCNSSTGYTETAIGDHILWRDINYADNTYDWYLLDKLLDSLHAHNTQMVYTFGRTPQWCATGGVSTGDVAPTDTLYLGKFVRAIAYRAIAKGWPIRTWEIWNEPETNSSEWKGTWSQLAVMGRCIYTNLKAIDATYTVLTPSTQGSGADYWMGQYFAAGGAPYCDVVAYHAYINFYSGGSGEKFETLIDKMRTLMATYSISSKELWDDEAFDNFYCPSGTLCAAPDVQAAYMAQRYFISAAKNLNRVYWYSWDQNNGIEWQNYALNNAGKAHATIRSWMIGATVSNLVITTDSIYSVDLTTAGVTKRAVWSNSALTKTYTTTYTQYETLTNTTGAVSGSLTLARKPVLLSGTSADVTIPTLTNAALTASSISQTGARINWTQATDNVTTQANLFYSTYQSSSDNITGVTNAQTNGTLKDSGTAKVSTTLTGLAANTPYYVNVVVRDQGGNKTAYNRVTFTTLPNAPATPGAPTLGTITTTSVVVNWSAVSGATSYNLYRDASSTGTFDALVAGNIAGTTYTDNTVAQGTTYYYAIKAVNSGGSSALSTASSAASVPANVLLPATPPAPTMNQAGNNYIILTVNSSTGATTYKLWRSTSATTGFSVIASGLSAGSYTDSNLSRNTNYYYRVSAVNGSGESAQGAYATAKTTTGFKVKNYTTQ